VLAVPFLFFRRLNVDMAEVIGTTRGNIYDVRFHIDLTTFDLQGEKKTEKRLNQEN
jgi:hypothetical protein